LRAALNHFRLDTPCHLKSTTTTTFTAPATQILHHRFSVNSNTTPNSLQLIQALVYSEALRLRLRLDAFPLLSFYNVLKKSGTLAPPLQARRVRVKFTFGRASPTPGSPRHDAFHPAPVKCVGLPCLTRLFFCVDAGGILPGLLKKASHIYASTPPPLLRDGATPNFFRVLFFQSTV